MPAPRKGPRPSEPRAACRKACSPPSGRHSSGRCRDPGNLDQTRRKGKRFWGPGGLSGGHVRGPGGAQRRVPRTVRIPVPRRCGTGRPGAEGCLSSRRPSVRDWGGRGLSGRVGCPPDGRREGGRPVAAPAEPEAASCGRRPGGGLAVRTYREDVRAFGPDAKERRARGLPRASRWQGTRPPGLDRSDSAAGQGCRGFRCLEVACLLIGMADAVARTCSAS
jgi:hypothetical protein